jgi:hypothetical protein
VIRGNITAKLKKNHQGLEGREGENKEEKRRETGVSKTVRMATTITINDVARCLAKRPLAETQGLNSPPSSKRARGDNDNMSSSVVPGEGDLISPPATIPTPPTASGACSGEAASSSSPVPEKQHPQLGMMSQYINSHFSQLQLQHPQLRFQPFAQLQRQEQERQSQQQQSQQQHSSLPKRIKVEIVPEEDEVDEDEEDFEEDEFDEDEDDEEFEEEDEVEGNDGRGAARDPDWDARSWNSGILPALPEGLSSAEVRAAREDEACGQSIEDTYKRTVSHFPNPAIMFPAPSLEFDFRIAVNLKPESTQVHGKCHKEITAVSSGTWSGSFGNGKITAGGYDLGQARGFRPIRIVEGAFVMQTSDESPAT